MNKTIISGLILSLVGGACFAEHPRVTELIKEKQSKMEKLEKCQGTTKNLKIAGISTLGITAVGVGANIAEAVILNDTKEDIAKAEKARDAQQAIKDKRDCENDSTKMWENGECKDKPAAESGAGDANQGGAEDGKKADEEKGDKSGNEGGSGDPAPTSNSVFGGKHCSFSQQKDKTGKVTENSCFENVDIATAQNQLEVKVKQFRDEIGGCKNKTINKHNNDKIDKYVVNCDNESDGTPNRFYVVFKNVNCTDTNNEFKDGNCVKKKAEEIAEKQEGKPETKTEDPDAIAYSQNSSCDKHVQGGSWEYNVDKSVCAQMGITVGTAWVKYANKEYALSSLCAMNEGEDANVGNPDVSLNSERKYCWCRNTASSGWVFSNSCDDAGDCSLNCASYCASNVLNHDGFRSALGVGSGA